MDMAPLILICSPILFPVEVTTLGMSPIQFGIMLLLITFVPFFSTFIPDLIMPELVPR
jgi:TRAP-type C4-dicarboxylate transport system permease large subunit